MKIFHDQCTFTICRLRVSQHWSMVGSVHNQGVLCSCNGHFRIGSSIHVILLFVYHRKYLTVGRGGERELYTNQSVLCRASILFTKSAKVQNKSFNWSICAEFKTSDSIGLFV